MVIQEDSMSRNYVIYVRRDVLSITHSKFLNVSNIISMFKSNINSIYYQKSNHKI